jgi:plastocyanin
MTNKMIPLAITGAILGGLVAAFVIYEVTDADTGEKNELVVPTVEGILIVSDGDRFNSTNPDIHLVANASEEVVVFNKDSDQHDFCVNGLNIKSAALNQGENITATLVAQQPGTYEYYCTFHPDVMRGNIVVGEV